MGFPEAIFGLGTIILLAALVWGAWAYQTRNRSNDRVTEKATRDLYRNPEHYNQEAEEAQLHQR